MDFAHPGPKIGTDVAGRHPHWSEINTPNVIGFVKTSAHLSSLDSIAVGWFTIINLVTFCAFGLDKWRAGRSGQRVSELTLVWLAALGGWPGGLIGMNVFRHKTAKWTFKLKYALALIPCAALLWAWWHWR